MPAIPRGRARFAEQVLPQGNLCVLMLQLDGRKAPVVKGGRVVDDVLKQPGQLLSFFFDFPVIYLILIVFH